MKVEFDESTNLRQFIAKPELLNEIDEIIKAYRQEGIVHWICVSFHELKGRKFFNIHAEKNQAPGFENKEVELN